LIKAYSKDIINLSEKLGKAYIVYHFTKTNKKEYAMNEYFMKKAIELAANGAGFVNPDPLSGAVIVKENRIIGEGYYKSYGAIPAETEAIFSASGDLVGAELYLTIEPFRAEQEEYEFCRLLKEKGIKKLYIGMLDPNPSKKGNLISELEKMDISYELGLLRDECEELNEIYAYYIQNKLPYVIVKWAMTLDGKLATKTGDSKWISSDESLKFVHQLRQRVGAILVGENTVKIDDPRLTTRLDGVTISNPLRVIISKYGDIPLNSKVLQVDDNTKTLIIASEFISKDKEDALLQTGVEIAKLRETNNHIEFKDIMALLGSMEIDSLYIEGGSSILASAFESGCIHKVYTTIAPKIIGGSNAVTPVGGNGIELMRNAIVLKRVSHEIVGPDVIVKGYIY
jgi:diaminohydroxyphosphoribosylaminopyrimidine deaminase/5-amino-6-(5-phosphoribosylamino)uracil reductase